MMLRNTIKWELRKWRDEMAWMPILLAGLWVVLAVLPIPLGYWQGFWHGTLELIVPGALIFAGVFATFAALLMILVYPFLTSFSDLRKTALLEHQTGYPYVYRLFTRLGLNVITYFLGVGVLWVTMFLLRRFEAFVDAQWFSNMLADSPVLLLPMVFTFALGAPLILLFGYKFFNFVSSGRIDKTAWMDIAGFLAASGILALLPLTERIVEWLPFAAAMAIMAAGYLALTIVAVFLISRFIDRFSEVAV